MNTNKDLYSFIQCKTFLPIFQKLGQLLEKIKQKIFLFLNITYALRPSDLVLSWLITLCNGCVTQVKLYQSKPHNHAVLVTSLHCWLRCLISSCFACGVIILWSTHLRKGGGNEITETFKRVGFLILKKGVWVNKVEQERARVGFSLYSKHWGEMGTSRERSHTMFHTIV